MLLSEIVTKHDLKLFKQELIAEIKALNFQQPKQAEKLLKSNDVQKMLGCSPSTLQCHRQSGKLPFSKVGGTYYYTQQGVTNLLNS
jgi:hypothetical protein